MKRGDVIRDVGYALREEIIRNTWFTRDNFSSSIVPSAAPPQGWEAKKANWGLLLGNIAKRLSLMDSKYKFRPDPDFVRDTLDVPVKTTVGLITDTIMAGGANA
jgi:hypothetical protein